LRSTSEHESKPAKEIKNQCYSDTGVSRVRNIREFEVTLLTELTRAKIITASDKSELLSEKNSKKKAILENLFEKELLDDAWYLAFVSRHFSARILSDNETVNIGSGRMEDELFKEYAVFVNKIDDTRSVVYFSEPVFETFWSDIEEKLGGTVERVAIEHALYTELKEKTEENIEIRKKLAISSQEEILALPEGQRAIMFAEEVINKCIKLNASDVHIEPQKHNFRIRMRLNGVLQQFGEYNKDFFPAFSSRIKLISQLDIAEKRDTQDGSLLHTYVNEETGEETDIPFRISVMPIIYGEKIVMRKLGGDTSITLEKLGMSTNILEPWIRITGKAHGIILVSGPTGSGKSTTLQATVNEIKSVEINISTVEDPVEAKIPGINQVQIDSHKVSFADALRSLLRQDPDVIMIGEVRDAETAEIALRASLTGHMVYSTIHTNDAASSVTRLVDMGIEPFLVSSSVVGVLAQRLLRVLCDSCKRAYITDESEMSLIGLDEPCEVYAAEGCAICSNTGYTGRVGVYELLIVDAHIRKMINDGKSDVDIKIYATEELGMTTLLKEAKRHFLSGKISLEEVKKML